MTKLALMGQMMAFKHDGFWQPMDTLRDKNQPEQLWESDRALESHGNNQIETNF